ncbi:nuclear transcription factor Y subunit B-8-like [Triticum dicoccoides]|uniref:nuclear transcription factor Y subunit B-8-like n=1 Tax=Triticum dicoccoides TaxID=85692 RepID=UPI0018911C94|nr:nuclear transcription factor Y subunit B-8-like [Triticum dicoccoides]
MENDGVPNGPVAPAPTQATPVGREQDRLMPNANVIRIMRRALPAHAKISDDAKEAIQECVSEFISFVTGEANERCRMQHRKTVNAEDIMWALNRLGFDDYVVPLSVFLHRMRDPEAGTGRAAAGDSRAMTSAPPRVARPVIHTVPLQAQRPMYAPPASVQVQNQMQRPVYAPPAPVQVQNQVQRPVYAPPALLQVQMQRGIYGPRAPVHGYAVGMAPVRAKVGGQYQVFGGERVMTQQYYGYGYGEGAYGAGSSNGGAAIGDEESSSNDVPAPGEGTEEPEPEPAAEESQDKPVQSG